MKYKIGDKVRLKSGAWGVIKAIGDDDLTYYITVTLSDGMLCLTNESKISHLIISEITDEVIDRFRNEKIAWNFKTKEAYENTLDILRNKEIKFWADEQSSEYYDNYKDEFGINFDIEYKRLFCTDITYYKSIGYEIIEIMNPVYVPIGGMTEEIEVHGIYKYDNCLKGNVKGKPVYKGIDCEEMWQWYMKREEIEKKVKKIEKQFEDLEKELPRNILRVIHELTEE